MTTRRRLKYADGQVAIYDIDSGSPDDDPLTDPLGNISRLHFHSDLPSPAIRKTGGAFVRTGTINLTSLAEDNIRTSTNNLFAHGLGGTPLVFGKLVIDNSVTVPLNGSVTLNLSGNTIAGQMSIRVCHLGADGTNVMLRVREVTGFDQTLAAMELDWSIYVTNIILEGTDPGTGDDTLLTVRPEYMTAGQGKFDSRLRYLRKESSSPLINMVKSRTLALNPRESPGIAPSAKYEIAGFSKTLGPDPPSFTATYQGATF